MKSRDEIALEMRLKQIGAESEAEEKRRDESGNEADGIDPSGGMEVDDDGGEGEDQEEQGETVLGADWVKE